jgi:hypothetical protein
MQRPRHLVENSASANAREERARRAASQERIAFLITVMWISIDDNNYRYEPWVASPMGLHRALHDPPAHVVTIDDKRGRTPACHGYCEESFSSRDLEVLSQWYARHLGVPYKAGEGAAFRWADDLQASAGMTVWSAFPVDTKYFDPSPAPFMIVFRVVSHGSTIRRETR